MLSVQAVPGDPKACRVHCAPLNATLQIDGIAPAAMDWRLHRRGQAWDWSTLSGQAALRVRLLNAPSSTPGEQPVIEKDLADGRVQLTSAGEARVRVEAHHREGQTILPTSLYLAMAHQWAQCGILPLHAAGLVSPTGGILVTGGKGAGKSTLTAAALCAGWPIVTDDWLLLGTVQGQIQGCRIRNFLMLRESWATEQLKNRMGRNELVPDGARPKQVLSFPADDARFPSCADFKHLWCLHRPTGGRRQTTRQLAQTPAETLARLIEASMPLLFSARLPNERQQLMATAQSLTDELSSLRLETGLDLVEEAPATLETIGGNIQLPEQSV